MLKILLNWSYVFVLNMFIAFYICCICPDALQTTFALEANTMNSEQTALPKGEAWPSGYKTFFMLDSIEHEISIDKRQNGNE